MVREKFCKPIYEKSDENIIDLFLLIRQCRFRTVFYRPYTGHDMYGVATETLKAEEEAFVAGRTANPNEMYCFRLGAHSWIVGQ